MAGGNQWAPARSTPDGPAFHHMEDVKTNGDHLGVELEREGARGAFYQQVLRSEKLTASLYEEISMLEETLGAILLPEYAKESMDGDTAAKPADRMSELQAQMRRHNTVLEGLASRLEALRRRVDL